MITAIRWKIANWIAPDMAPGTAELRSCLLQIYRWTKNKNSPWAKRTEKALGLCNGMGP